MVVYVFRYFSLRRYGKQRCPIANVVGDTNSLTILERLDRGFLREPLKERVTLDLLRPYIVASRLAERSLIVIVS